MARSSAAAVEQPSTSFHSCCSSETSSIILDTASKASTSTRPTSVSSIESQKAVPISKKRVTRPSQTGRLASFGFTTSPTTTRLTKTQSSPASVAPRSKRSRPSSSNKPVTWLEESSGEEDMRDFNTSSTAPLLGQNSELETLPKPNISPAIDVEMIDDDAEMQEEDIDHRTTLKLVSTWDTVKRQLSGQILVGDDASLKVKKTAGSKCSMEEDPLIVQSVHDQAQTESKSNHTGVHKMLVAVTVKASSLGKRGREAFEKGKETLQSFELRRCDADVIDESEKVPAPERSAKRIKRSAVNAPALSSTSVNTKSSPKKQVRSKKIWLKHGLYVGQYRSGTQHRAKRAELSETTVPQENKSLPLPMFFGDDILRIGRDFKLPFDIYNPLPPGQAKPGEWKKTQSNRIIGDAIHTVKNWSKFSKLPSSRCICSASTGCDENCLNRTMLYECDSNNCALGDEDCSNRAFAELKERCKTGRKYDIGVEVIKTAGKGFGIRANRTFEPNQVIVEYAGEIIDQEECERRMHEEYKDAKCYYLMLFDNNMIIDATRGTIARFVNHSCESNCEMIKWNVAGKPRMALFAGDNGIMTGDELTYDYNFNNFNESNTTPCFCGAPSCRGVLGRKPTEQEAKRAKKTFMEEAAASAKAALENAFAGRGKDGGKKKKHKGWVYLDANDNEIEEPEKPATATSSNGRKRKIQVESSNRDLKRALSGLRKKGKAGHP